MDSKFFGEFLVKKGILSKKQLGDLLEEQRNINKKIGELSIRRKYLKDRDVNSILEFQIINDASFGEIAIREGYLKEEEVNDLLFFQEIENFHLGELLVRRGMISLKELSSLLEEFYELEEKRRWSFFKEIKKKFPKELLVFIETLEKYFIRIRHGLLKPIGTNIDASGFLSEGYLFSLEVGDNKYYLLVGEGEKKSPFSFVNLERIVENYLSKKNIYFKIEIIETKDRDNRDGGIQRLVGVDGKNNLAFISSTGDFVIIFY